MKVRSIMRNRSTIPPLKCCGPLDCRVRYVDGRGSFRGWRLKLCTVHQVIVKMWKKGEPS